MRPILANEIEGAYPLMNDILRSAVAVAVAVDCAGRW